MLYVVDFQPLLVIAQLVRRQLAEIELDVDVRPIPPSAFYTRLADPGEQWDLAVGPLWAPAFIDPYTFINELFATPISRGGGNLGRFNSSTFSRLMQQAARLQGTERYRAYAALDARLARDGAPSAAISFFSEPTLVSKRVAAASSCDPSLDLTAVCLK